MSKWYNPSKSAVVYDRRNNVHIQPGEMSSKQPYEELTRMGRLLQISDDDTPQIVVTDAPIMVNSGRMEMDTDSKKGKTKKR